MFAFASHGLFSKAANSHITESVLEQVVVLNTIPLSAQSKENPKIVQLSVAPLLADAIRAIHGKQSVSQIFDEGKQSFLYLTCLLELSYFHSLFSSTTTPLYSEGYSFSRWNLQFPSLLHSKGTSARPVVQLEPIVS